MDAVSTGILVGNDEPQVRSAVSTRLAGYGFDRQTPSHPQLARGFLARRQFHVLITEIGMPQVNGLSLLIHAKQHAGRNTMPPHKLAISMRIARGPPAEDVGGLGKGKG